MKVYVKQNDKFYISLIIYDIENCYVFDKWDFYKTVKENVNLSNYSELLSLGNEVNIEGVRNYHDDVFFVLLSNNLLIQISTIPDSEGISQVVSCYENTHPDYQSRLKIYRQSELSGLEWLDGDDPN